MSWSYAKLSKVAKIAGGPENLIQTIFAKGEAIGYVKGIKDLITFIVLAIASKVVIKFVYDYYKEKITIVIVEVKKARQVLIWGLM